MTTCTSSIHLLYITTEAFSVMTSWSPLLKVLAQAASGLDMEPVPLTGTGQYSPVLHGGGG